MDEINPTREGGADHDALPKKEWTKPALIEIKIADHTEGLVDILKHGLLHPMAGS